MGTESCQVFGYLTEKEDEEKYKKANAQDSNKFIPSGREEWSNSRLAYREHEMRCGYFKQVEFEVSPNTNAEQHNRESETVSSEDDLNQGWMEHQIFVLSVASGMVLSPSKENSMKQT